MPMQWMGLRAQSVPWNSHLVWITQFGSIKPGMNVNRFQFGRAEPYGLDYCYIRLRHILTFMVGVYFL